MPDSKANLEVAFQHVAVTRVSLSPSASSSKAGDTLQLTATVSPDNATNKKVKWSVGGENASAVALYSDADCKTPLGADATKALTVYAKCNSVGSAVVTAASNEDGSKSAACRVTVSKGENPLTYPATQTVSKTFSTSAQTAALTAAENGQGNVTYAINSQKDSKNADVNYFTLDGTTLTLAANTPAGTYTVGVRATAAGNNSYNEGTKDSTVTVTVNKATVTAPTIASKTYTGEPLTADVAASNLYTVTANAGGTNVGEYDVVLTLTDSNNYKWTDSEEAAKTLKFNITKDAAPTVTVPTPEAVTYDPAKTLTDVTLPDGWAWVDSTILPTVGNSGYQAALTVDGNNYDYSSVEGYSADTQKVTRTVALTVNKAEVTAPTIESKVYNVQPQTADVATSDLYTVTTNEGGTNVGDYNVVLTLADADNYKWTDSDEAAKTLVFQITKADSSSAVSNKALSFTGQPQPLVNAGTVSGGTLQYALGTDANTAPADGWSTEIPTATEPGTYYVWYKVVGDENHNGVDPACIVVTIAEPEAVPTEPEAAPAAPESVSDYTLLASMKTSGNKAFKLKWTAVTGAEGYDVFLGRVGKEAELKTSVNGTSCKIGKLKKGKAYRAFVKAWRTENGQKVYIGQASPEVYAITGGRNNRYTNPKKITVKKKNLTVAVGGSKKIKASLKKFSNSRRYLNHTAKIRYFSSDHTVATVNAKGKVTGVAPGTCTVYAVAENGLRKGVKITVK